MDSTHPAVVQAEFFLTGQHTTLGALCAKIGERLADDARIKITVRYFDHNGSTTHLAQKVQRLQERLDKLMLTMQLTTQAVYWWQWMLLDVKVLWTILHLAATRKRTENLARASVEEAVLNSRDIAIEDTDCTFHRARRDEMHELIQTVRRATGVWVFVFKPNGLLADTNETLAYSM